jgi:hypothetical protein
MTVLVGFSHGMVGVMEYIPMSTHPALLIEEDASEFKLYVLFADGRPVEMTESEDVVHCALALADEMPGSIIEWQSADGVSSSDMAELALALGGAPAAWPEFVGDVECGTCGDTGVQEVCNDVDGECVRMQGDCPQCGTD